MCGCVCVSSLCVGHGGVLDECEVVGDVLVVRQPPMGPHQTVLTHRHLEREAQFKGEVENTYYYYYKDC